MADTITNDEIRLMLIGVGPHAKTFYIPSISRISGSEDVRICCLVDLIGKEGELRGYTEANSVESELLLVEKSAALTGETIRLLGEAVDKHGITGAIISTDPLYHRQYAEWAISKGLHILMDKPITTRDDAVSNGRQAKGIEEDFESLHKAYLKLQKKRRTCFTICSHRRYHPGIKEVCRLVGEVSGKTGCPVTSLHSYHCDGQWRMPSEIMAQEHHSYHHGHGKVSHSGYHFIDCLCSFWKAGCASGKTPDFVEVFSNFVQPTGLLEQISRKDYVRIFGGKYLESCPLSDSKLRKKFKRFGEVDTDISFLFHRHGIPFGSGSLSLVHNGFSRRSWLMPGKDLYKGNGRVKHEQHIVNVGPFLSIQVHSYQAKDRHETSGEEDFIVGGNNHFEIYIFRNSQIIGGKPVELLDLRDIEGSSAFDSKRLFIEQVKAGAVREFIDFIRGRLGPHELSSNIGSHLLPVRLMSAAYLSHIRRNSKPVVRVEWHE